MVDKRSLRWAHSIQRRSQLSYPMASPYSPSQTPLLWSGPLWWKKKTKRQHTLGQPEQLGTFNDLVWMGDSGSCPGQCWQLQFSAGVKVTGTWKQWLPESGLHAIVCMQLGQRQKSVEKLGAGSSGAQVPKCVIQPPGRALSLDRWWCRVGGGWQIKNCSPATTSTAIRLKFIRMDDDVPRPRPLPPHTALPSAGSASVLSGTMASGCRGASFSSRLSPNRPATPFLSLNSSSMLYTIAICGLHWQWDVLENLSQSTQFLRATLMTLHSPADEVMFKILGKKAS